jgi:hypothetical protein
MREFDTGATRDEDDSKLDYEGFLSPLVLEQFASYMHRHRTQKDGSIRPSDNWQKGIPFDAYMKSMLRHQMEAWSLHRQNGDIEDKIEALCAMMFNIQGYMFELLKLRKLRDG